MAKTRPEYSQRNAQISSDISKIIQWEVTTLFIAYMYLYCTTQCIKTKSKPDT